MTTLEFQSTARASLERDSAEYVHGTEALATVAHLEDRRPRGHLAHGMLDCLGHP